MQSTDLEPLAKRVLRALYELAELDCPADAGLLGRAAGVRASEAAEALLSLEARGLVMAERARLTLTGLALAVRSPALGLAGAPWLARSPRAAPAPGHEPSAVQPRSALRGESG